MAEEGYRAAIAAALALSSEGPATVVIDSADDAVGISLTEQIEKAREIGAAWVVEIPHIGGALEQLAKREDGVSVFHLDEVPGSLFVTSETLVGDKSNVLVSKGRIGYRAPEVESAAPTNFAKSTRVTRIVKTAEERFVFGVVLQPETKDSQGDIYSADEVRVAAHTYMEKAQALGKQHGEIITGKLKILESYVAPTDFALETETITKGTWLLGIRVVDDDLWTEVKKGSFTGFSIGGEAFRTPETDG